MSLLLTAGIDAGVLRAVVLGLWGEQVELGSDQLSGLLVKCLIRCVLPLSTLGAEFRRQ